jgi:hypothetical protein
MDAADFWRILPGRPGLDACWPLRLLAMQVPSEHRMRATQNQCDRPRAHLTQKFTHFQAINFTGPCSQAHTGRP